MQTISPKKLAETTGGALWAPYPSPYAYAPYAVPWRPAFRPSLASYWAPRYALPVGWY